MTDKKELIKLFQDHAKSKTLSVNEILHEYFAQGMDMNIGRYRFGTSKQLFTVVNILYQCSISYREFSNLCELYDHSNAYYWKQFYVSMHGVDDGADIEDIIEQADILHDCLSDSTSAYSETVEEYQELMDSHDEMVNDLEDAKSVHEGEIRALEQSFNEEIADLEDRLRDAEQEVSSMVEDAGNH